ncbi:RING-H2 finger protein ATL30-like [Rutidosis leptorrhynchoides]|uniref:RING-H2 finger protein ATL30-like n=1 Tax=Rutidosis leptorrhynchoides TaxID=125765 RepID=UPI003A99A232
MSGHVEITSPSPESSNHYSSPPVTIVLTVILLILFFLGFFSIYFCRCFFENVSDTWHFRRGPNHGGGGHNANRPGLDPVLIQYFPTFAYSDVKDLGRRKCGLECAICLGDFRDDELLRLITVCYHIFHQECIDLWLESHKTCPVCRGNLDLPAESLLKSPVILHEENDNNNTNPSEEHGNFKMSDHDSVSITVRDGGNENGNYHNRLQSCSDHNSNGNSGTLMEKFFSRSHSTGHDSSSVSGKDQDLVCDKHKLILPENAKIMITRGHNWTKSCITFGELGASSPYRSTLSIASNPEPSGSSNADQVGH